MAFTVNDVRDLIRLLAEHPEWRAELRPLILGDEFAEVPARIAAIDERIAAMAGEIAAINVRIAAIDERIAEMDARFTARFDAIDERNAQMAAEIAAINVRIAQMDERLSRRNDAIDERIAAIDERIAEMDARFTARFDALDTRMNRIEGRFGNVDGAALQLRYEQNLGQWLSDYLDRPVKVGVRQLERVVSARADGTLTEADYQRISATDMLVQGQDTGGFDEVLLAGEISTRLDSDDVARAEATVEILRNLGYRTSGFLGGHEIDDDAQQLADSLEMIVDLRRRKG